MKNDALKMSCRLRIAAFLYSHMPVMCGHHWRIALLKAAVRVKLNSNIENLYLEAQFWVLDPFAPHLELFGLRSNRS
jgi:hypothetical protein